MATNLGVTVLTLLHAYRFCSTNPGMATNLGVAVLILLHAYRFCTTNPGTDTNPGVIALTLFHAYRLCTANPEMAANPRVAMLTLLHAYRPLTQGRLLTKRIIPHTSTFMHTTYNKEVEFPLSKRTILSSKINLLELWIATNSGCACMLYVCMRSVNVTDANTSLVTAAPYLKVK